MESISLFIICSHCKGTMSSWHFLQADVGFDQSVGDTNRFWPTWRILSRRSHIEQFTYLANLPMPSLSCITTTLLMVCGNSDLSDLSWFVCLSSVLDDTLCILYVIWCYTYTYPYSRTVGGQTCFIWYGAVFLTACTILEFGAKNSDLNATCSILEHVESICTILEREEEKNGRASWACGLLFHVFCFCFSDFTAFQFWWPCWACGLYASTFWFLAV